MIGVPTDVSRAEQVEQLAAATINEYGAVHVLCNNAGVMANALLPGEGGGTLEEWEWMMRHSFWSAVHGVRTFLPLIEREDEGHISATSSMCGLSASCTMAAYNSAKHAVVGLMTTLERELRAMGSTVHASVLCPTAVVGNLSETSFASKKRELGSEHFPSEATNAMLSEMMPRIMEETSFPRQTPDGVGEIVLAGIRENRFWLFTEDTYSVSEVRQQTEDLMADRSLYQAYVNPAPKARA